MVRFKQNNLISSKINDHGKQIDISRLVSMIFMFVGFVVIEIRLFNRKKKKKKKQKKKNMATL